MMEANFNTVILNAEDIFALEKAAEYIKKGIPVAVPTETVYGLAGNALDDNSVKEIFTVKGRPQDNPLIVHIADISMWNELVTSVTKDAKKLADAFWPGPLTIILPKSDKVPLITTGGLDSVAVRMPNNEYTRKLIRICGVPLAAPSANLSGFPSTTTAQHCMNDLKGKIPLILDGGDCSVGIESTVISLLEKPMILRPGDITPLEIERVLGKKVYISHAVSAALNEGEKVSSPGMKYKHYSPKAKVLLLRGSLDSFLWELKNAPLDTYALVFKGEEKHFPEISLSYGEENNAKSQSREIFACLRKLDDMGAKNILVRCPKEDEDSLGVYNRLLRAAGFEVRDI